MIKLLSGTHDAKPRLNKVTDLDCALGAYRSMELAVPKRHAANSIRQRGGGLGMSDMQGSVKPVSSCWDIAWEVCSETALNA